jgi:putative peptide maturation system protein
MILILAAGDDEHAAAVEPELRRRGASVLWLDLSELPAQGEISVAYEPGERARPRLRVRHSEIDLRAVTAVWSLRPRAPVPHDNVPAGAVRDYVKQETLDAWIGVSALLECPWLPAPRWQEQRASHKPLQLQVASELGFEIPPTLITNSRQDFLDFYRRHNGAIVSKTVHNRLLPVDPSEGYTAYVLTEVVANRDAGYADTVRYCPVTVQPYVDKRVELRVTVVGDRVFPVALESQWTNHTRHDWRRGDHHHGRYAIHDLPPADARRCVELVRRLGLSFGALDLILTPDGRYVFLEINPNGAWLWMQRTTGLPIGAAICDLLMSHESPSRSSGVIASSSRPSSNPTPRAAVPPPIASPPAVPRVPRPIPPAVDAALGATLRYLVELADAGARPAEAIAGFRRLAERYREADPSLVWEAEGHLGRVHYDALLRLPGAGTLSLAVAPDRGLPWALRHAHHARESDLLRVNGLTLNMQTVMGYLDGLWYDARLLGSLIDGCLVREAVDTRGIEGSDAEVRKATTVFRRARRLTAEPALNAWLRQRGWTAYDLEHEMRRTVIAGKLRRQIAGHQVREYFACHRRELALAVIGRVRAGDLPAARRVARRIRRGALAFSQVETVRRRDLPAAHARAVFAAAPDTVLGPLPGADGHDVVWVARTIRARLDGPTRELIEAILFEEWLAARRAEASVEWFWGDTERARTSPRGGGVG